MALDIYIIAGEASGDFLGSHLIRSLYCLKPHLKIQGIGGSLMKKEGLESLFPMEKISLMGITEIVPHIPQLYKLIKLTIRDIVRSKPKVLVTIDSPGFCYRVAQSVKKLIPNLKIVHYVAPSVWAWRQNRAYKLSQFVDHLLTLFPFEPPYFLIHGLKTTFVGHPLTEQSLSVEQGFRDRLKIPKNAVILNLLAGSRENEIKKLIPVFCKTVQRLSKSLPHLFILAPTLPMFESLIETALLKTQLPHRVITDPFDKYNSFRISDVALAASGTVSLELALANLPMVIAYKISFLTYWIAKFLIKINNVCLVNVLLNKRIIPEYLQRDCHEKNLAPCLESLLEEQGALQKPYLSKVIHLLENPEKIRPSEKAAQIIIDLL